MEKDASTESAAMSGTAANTVFLSTEIPQNWNQEFPQQINQDPAVMEPLLCMSALHAVAAACKVTS